MKKSLWSYAYLTTNIIKKKIKKKLFKIKQKKKKGENCERLLSMNLSLSLSLSLSLCVQFASVLLTHSCGLLSQHKSR
jgi:hypothetical protein